MVKLAFSITNDQVIQKTVGKLTFFSQLDRFVVENASLAKDETVIWNGVSV